MLKINYFHVTMEKLSHESEQNWWKKNDVNIIKRY